MADDGEGKKGTQADPGKAGQDPGGAGGEGGKGSDPPPGGDKKDLSKASADELIGIITDLRKSEAGYRQRAQKAEGDLGNLTTKVNDLEKKVKGNEDEKKTAEQRAADERQALEAKAALTDSLQPYATHVKSELDAEMERINALEDADRKKTYTDFLSTLPENDHLGRLRAIRAFRAAEGKPDGVKPGDQDHPGKTGQGTAEQSLVQKIGWSPSAMRAARATGQVPRETKK